MADSFLDNMLGHKEAEKVRGHQRQVMGEPLFTVFFILRRGQHEVGVEFTSGPLTEDSANNAIAQLREKGIQAYGQAADQARG